MRRTVMQIVAAFGGVAMFVGLARAAGDAAVTVPPHAGYDLLEYVESDGTAYVNTGVTVAPNTVIDIKVQLLKDPGANYVSYVGARDQNERKGQLGGWFYGVNHYQGVTYPEAHLGAAKLNTDYTVHLDKNGPCTINGEQFATGSGTGNSYAITVFCLNQKGGVNFRGSFRVYYCDIAYGNEMQRKLLPARRRSDGAVGFLDVKNPAALVFYSNAITSGVLTAGPVTSADITLTQDDVWTEGRELSGTIDLAGHKLTVSSLTGDATITSSADAGYDIFEYLESDGKAYVNTDVTVASNTVIDIKVQLLKDPAGAWVSYVGARDQDNRTGQLGGWFHGLYHYQGVKDPEANLGAAKLNTDYTVHLDKNGPCTINGEQFATGSGIGNDYTITVFCLNQKGGVSFKGSFRVYSCRIAYGSEVQRDLKPARRRFDGAVGFLDVKDPAAPVFYPNVGLGSTLTVGPVVSEAFARPPAELHVAVANEQTAENATVAILGPVRVVKEGSGTLVATKQKQTYRGGTDVAAGTFRCGSEGVAGIYGFNGSVVTVREGATFDCDGWWNHYGHSFVLDGGTIKSQNNRATQHVAWFADVELTKDSFWYGCNYGFVNRGWAASRLLMNGHTLTVDVTNGGDFFAGNLTVEGGGELYMRTGGWFGIGGMNAGGVTTYDTYFRAETTTLRMGGAAFEDFGGEHVFGSYVSAYTGNYGRNHHHSSVKVLGRFVPGTRWHSTELQDGATLDLSACTAVWNTACQFTTSGTTGTATFAANATVNLDIGERVLVNGMKLVGWTDADAPSSTVTFKLPDAISENFMLERRPDGLYVTAAVKTATWTGAAGTTDSTNPGNWTCRDANGNVIDGARPGSVTAVTVSGAVQLDIPASSTFSCASFTCDNVSLKGDCDWRGLGAPLNDPIDLAGHKLTVSSLTGDATITSSAVAGYDILEYIDSADRAYVDTGVTVAGNTVIDIKVQLLKDPGKSYVSYVGARDQNDRKGQLGGWFYGLQHHSAVTEQEERCGQAALFTDYAVHLDKNGPCTINGVKFATGNGIGNDYAITIFCLRQEGGVNFWGSFRVYSCRIAYGSEVQRDLKPARRRSDGVVGFLDVKDPAAPVFYANANSSGTLSAGPVVSGEFAKPPAELHVDVANGQVTENSSVAITGPVRVVKEGAGTFVAKKEGQSFTGGLLVEGGTFMCGNVGTKYVYGPNGGMVTVCQGATFDCDGWWDHYQHFFVLDGGTIKSQTSRATQREAWFEDVVLMKDSFCAGANYGFVGKSGAPCRLQMNGCKLTVDVPGSQYFFAGDLTVEGGGEIFIKKGGNFGVGGWRYENQITGGKYVRAETTTLRMGAAAIYDFGGEHVFGSYVSEYTLGYDTQNTVIKVLDRFVPGVQWHATELQDGATLDLSSCAGTWNTTCTFQQSKVSATATFAEGATISVDLGKRKVKSSEPLITWAAKPTNVKFRATQEAGVHLKVRDDGLYPVIGFSVIVR